MKRQLLAQGAEAKVFQQGEIVSKERIEKSYRHPALDKQIRKSRTKKESKILSKAIELEVSVPNILNTDTFNLEIEFIKGDRLSETLNSYNEKKQGEVMQKIGKQATLLHDNDLIHGDLTTSNIILKDNEVFIIDFGLGFVSSKIEDKAVDIHLIKQALEAKHFQNHEELYKEFLKSYKPKEINKILERLAAVEKRGRYRH